MLSLPNCGELAQKVPFTVKHLGEYIKKEWQKASHGWQEGYGSKRDWKGKIDTCKLSLFLLSCLFDSHDMLIQKIVGKRNSCIFILVSCWSLFASCSEVGRTNVSEVWRTGEFPGSVFDAIQQENASIPSTGIGDGSMEKHFTYVSLSVCLDTEFCGHIMHLFNRLFSLVVL